MTRPPDDFRSLIQDNADRAFRDGFWTGAIGAGIGAVLLALLTYAA